MNPLIIVLIASTCIAGSFQNPTGPSNQQDIVDYINKIGTTWKAAKHFDDNSFTNAHKLMGVIETNEKLNYVKRPIDPELEIPEQFDGREHWPQCETFKQIRDQGSCGSCWAFATVEAISDRICVATGQNVEISGEDLVSCCHLCGFGCRGGFPTQAWKHWVNTGLVSGGGYKSEKGCRPYSIADCEHHTTGKRPPCPKELAPTPSCQKTCRSGYNVTYDKDLHFGADAYVFSNDNKAVQQEIMTTGSVVAAFTVFEDFMLYKSGIYQHHTGGRLGGHAVKIIGWGVENGVKYWLVVNSWNEDWGENGLFRILRGSDECAFEAQITSGKVKVA